MSSAPGPRVTITYCTQCRWLLRASWLAQELLTTFTTDIGELALKPGTGGVFQVRVGEEVVWDRKVDGGFPEVGPLKRLVRDRVSPGRALGHTDRAAALAPAADPAASDADPATSLAEAVADVVDPAASGADPAASGADPATSTADHTHGGS